MSLALVEAASSPSETRPREVGPAEPYPLFQPSSAIFPLVQNPNDMGIQQTVSKPNNINLVIVSGARNPQRNFTLGTLVRLSPHFAAL